MGRSGRAVIAGRLKFSMEIEPADANLTLEIELERRAFRNIDIGVGAQTACIRKRQVALVYPGRAGIAVGAGERLGAGTDFGDGGCRFARSVIGIDNTAGYFSGAGRGTLDPSSTVPFPNFRQNNELRTQG